MDGNKSVDAQFDLLPTYSLTITMSGTGSGTVEVSPPGPYYYGDVVTLWANASVNSTFTGWSGDLSGSTTPDSLTMTKDMDVDAEFMLSGPYTLTINVVGNGTVVKDPDQATYTYGTLVELTAVADSGWVFSHWSGDLTGSTNPETINMTSNKTVTTTFTQDFELEKALLLGFISNINPFGDFISFEAVFLIYIPLSDPTNFKRLDSGELVISEEILGVIIGDTLGFIVGLYDATVILDTSYRLQHSIHSIPKHNKNCEIFKERLTSLIRQ